MVFSSKNLATLIFFLFILTLISIYFLPVGIKNYSPFIIALTFPFSGYLFLKSHYKFSNEIKKVYPKVFKRNEIYYGYFKGEVLMVQSIFDEIEFKKIEDLQLRNLYLETKNLFKYLIINFLLIPFSAIILIVSI